jgi:hypothetical protein
VAARKSCAGKGPGDCAAGIAECLKSGANDAAVAVPITASVAAADKTSGGATAGAAPTL